jgi:hypothetical protein
MNSIPELSLKINPDIYPHLDKLTFRTDRVTDKQLYALKDSARFAGVGRGHYMPINPALPVLLTVVVPTERALHLLVEKKPLICNYGEPAIDYISSTRRESMQINDLFEDHFVHSRHGKHQVVKFDNGGVATGQRRKGRRFVWYSDLPSKVTGELNCFHLEGRHQGTDALRRINVYEPSDWLTFDHATYWRQNLRLLDVNLERLGRFGSGRRKSLVEHFSSGTFNRDLFRGSILFRDRAAVEELQRYSIQRFADNSSRAQCLHKLNVSALLP